MTKERQEYRPPRRIPESESYFVIDASDKKIFDWHELWRYRELFYFFAWRDIKVKYKQTALGFLWAILQPVIMMIIFTLFFGRTLKVPSQNLPYPVFVFSGLVIWNVFSSGLINASGGMVTNAAIIKKVYFPRLAIPVSSVLVSLFDFLMSFPLFLGMLAFYGLSPSIHAFWLWPLSVAITMISTLGPGALFGAFNVKYRDFRYVIPFMVQILFFLTPVIYPVSMLSDEILRYVLALSPMYAAIEMFRLPLTGAIADGTLLTVSIIGTFSFLVAGLYYFKRTEDYFADFA